MLFDNAKFKSLDSTFESTFSDKQLYKVPYEPLKENRFLIDLIDSDIPPYLVNDYTLYNNGGEIFYFEVNFIELLNFVYNPKDIFKIESVQIKYLDPIGEVINGLTFKVKDVSFERNQSYKNDKIQINKLKFKVVFNSIEILDKNYKKI